MKLSFGRLVVVGLVLIAAVLFFNSLHSRNLPSGKIIQTKPVGLGNDNITPMSITGRPQIEISTTKGNFIIELRPDLAQETVVNFLNKWAAGDCNFLNFYYIDSRQVQACDPNSNGTGGQDTLPLETSSADFNRGSIGAVRSSPAADKSNDMRFFIIKKDSPSLNGQYTYFGKVILGMDVVDSLTAGDLILSATPLTK